jgi:uncharacterized protein YraI
VRKLSSYVWSGLFVLLLAGCITVELKDERAIPTLFEIALVTHTPLPGTTQPVAPTALPPSPTSVTPTPVAPTETSSPQPLPSDTPSSSQTPTPAATLPIEGVIFLNAACRQGPGLVYPVATYIKPGEAVQVNGQNDDASWWQVQLTGEISACWVSGQVIHLNMTTADRLPVINAPPTPPVVQMNVPTPTPTHRSHPSKASGPTDTNVPPTSEPTSEPTTAPTPTNNPYPYP